MTETAKRSSRIEARITPYAHALLKRAAELQGRSISDFVVAAAEREARRTISETQVLDLSLAEQERVFEVLSRPAPYSPGLEDAMRAHRELISESR